jgi:hypothetical protein
MEEQAYKTPALGIILKSEKKPLYLFVDGIAKRCLDFGLRADTHIFIKLLGCDPVTGLDQQSQKSISNSRNI